MHTTQDTILPYLAAAVLDHWTLTTGALSDQRCQLEREGFTLIRFPSGLHLYGPDKLAVTVPEHYSWEAIQNNLLLCNLCHRYTNKIESYSYAGRACLDCASKEPLPDSVD